MLRAISWSQFTIFILIVAAGYYAYLGLVDYGLGQRLAGLFKKRRGEPKEEPADKEVMVAAVKKAVPLASDDGQRIVILRGAASGPTLGRPVVKRLPPAPQRTGITARREKAAAMPGEMGERSGRVKGVVAEDGGRGYSGIVSGEELPGEKEEWEQNEVLDGDDIVEDGRMQDGDEAAAVAPIGQEERRSDGEQGELFGAAPPVAEHDPVKFKETEGVILRLREMVSEAAASRTSRLDLEREMHLLLREHRSLLGSDYALGVNSFLVRTCATHFSLELTEEELDRLWGE